jgi:DNA (cytosine-5)-methyltransferase 1
LGKEDDRHLWPEMLRVIREVQPSWVVGENVLGLVNWSEGLVFHEVQADLEAEGYEVFPFVLPACAVNAPHRRDRVWFVAHSKRFRFKQCEQQEQSRCGEGVFEGICNNGDATNPNGINRRRVKYEYEKSERQTFGKSIKNSGKYGDVADTKSQGTWEQSSKNRGREDRRFDNDGKVWDVADTKSKRMEGDGSDWQQESHAYVGQGLPLCSSSAGISNWQNFPTQPPLRSGDDGLSARLDSITFPKWRNESIKAAGNAIVPQVALMIFRAIQESIGK